jgi:hypothetical protein
MIRILALLAVSLAAHAVEIGAWDFEHPADALAWHGLGGANIAIVADGSGHALEIVNRDSRHTVMATCQLALDPSWRRLMVGARLRASHLTLGSETWQDMRVAIEFHAADGRLIGYGDPPRLRADAPWTPLRSEFAIPAGAVTVLLQAANFAATGVCAFDDIRIWADPQHELVPGSGYRADFAAIASDGLPRGWCLTSGQQRVVDGALELDAGLGPVESQALIAVAPAWRRVRLGCRLSARGLVVGTTPSTTARLEIGFLDSEGRASTRAHPVPSLSRDAAWHGQAVDLDLPAGTRWLELRPHHAGKAGVFALDDITCSPLD